MTPKTEQEIRASERERCVKAISKRLLEAEGNIKTGMGSAIWFADGISEAIDIIKELK